MVKIIDEPSYREKKFVFKDRFQAGKILAEKLGEYKSRSDAIVLAVPAGGVPVGYIVAKNLSISFDIILVRKIQIPWNTEAGFGALSWDGEIVFNEPLVRSLNLRKDEIEDLVSKTKKTILERLKKFRGDKPMPDIEGIDVILVDDGLASGFTMLAAIKSVKKMGAQNIIVAVPTSSVSAIRLLRSEVDMLVSLNVRSVPSFAVADAYLEWHDLSDDEVKKILDGKEGTSKRIKNAIKDRKMCSLSAQLLRITKNIFHDFTINNIMQSIRNDMTGRVCIITGGTSGIGKATALGLAKLNATLVIVGKDKKRGESALEDIRSKSGNKNVNLMLADFSSQQSIRQLAQDFKSNYKRLDVLVNNVGVFMLRRSLTVDGIEKTFAVNHLAPFLLTNLLLDLLKSSAPSRIVNVASASHYGAKIHFEDVLGERRYIVGLRAYGQSKLANVLFTYELASRLKSTGVTVNCLHPGFVRTSLGRDNGPLFPFFKITGIFASKPEKGALTVVYLASSPEVSGVTGKYFTKRKQVRSSEESYNIETAKRLWQLSEELTGLPKTNEKLWKTGRIE
ncbi:MAG: SDR family NAD(P)-dependent oxidoreductase [Nitrososphaeria archaeon]